MKILIFFILKATKSKRPGDARLCGKFEGKKKYSFEDLRMRNVSASTYNKIPNNFVRINRAIRYKGGGKHALQRTKKCFEVA